MQNLNQPNKTVYVQNILEKIKLKDLEASFNQLFSNYGLVNKISVKKNIKLRGQAFVQFETQEGATAAVLALQGYLFYGKPLRTNYAKKASDLEAEQKGSDL